MRNGIVCFGIILTACAPGNPLPPTTLQTPEDAAVRNAIKGQIKDPESARFTALKAGRADDGSVLVCGFVNAKNSFGGYAGPRRFAARIRDGIAVVESLKDEAYTMGICHRHALPG